MGRLAGRVALVTGAARGQGRAIAERFAAEGAAVVMSDIGSQTRVGSYTLAGQDELAAAHEAILGTGARALAGVADVRDQEALDALVSRAIDEFGAMDIAVANAGVLHEGPFWEISDDEWRLVLDVNLMGAWHTAKAVAPHMSERGQGVILFTSSVMARDGGVGAAHYIASKAGVLGLMRGVAAELAPYGIRVNAVLPGGVDTVMGHHGAKGEERQAYLERTRAWFALPGLTALPPAAIADTMAWLASDEAAHVTGAEILVDGGSTLRPRAALSPSTPVGPPGGRL